MPGGKKKKATAKKGYVSQHTRKWTSQTRYNSKRIPVLLPRKYTCKLRYVDEIDLDPAVGGLSVTKSYRANDLYDPDSSGVGHQPMGFDQLCLFYKSFTVTKSTIRVTPMIKTTTGGLPCFVGVGLVAT